MSKYKKELRLLLSIIIRPKNTIKGALISSYKERNMNEIFLLITIPIAIIFLALTSFLVVGELFSLRYIGTRIFAVGRYLVSVKFFTPVLYYALFKYIGRIEVVFEDVSKSLFPIIVIQSCLNYTAGIVFINEFKIMSLVQLAINLWFLIMISFVLKYKYITGIKRTFIILVIPIIIYGWYYVV